MNAPAPPAPPASPGRLRRALGGLGLFFVFAGALVVSVVVHLDLAPTRRVVSVVTNELLGSLFKGKVVVGEIDRLDLLHGRLAIRSAVALDPRGDEVARIDGLRAGFDAVGLVKSVLGAGDLRIAVPLVHLDSAEVLLDRGPEGVPGIAEAFILRAPGPPPPPGARAVRVALDRIEIDRAVAHGQIAPSAAVDGELGYVVGSVQVAPEGVTVDVQSRIDARAPVPQPVSGDAVFHLRVPPGRSATPEGMLYTGSFDGSVGDLEVHATGTMDGNHVSGAVDVPRATADAIAAFVPGGPVQLPLRVPIAASLEVEGDRPELAFHTWETFEDGGGVRVDGRLTVAAPLLLEATFGVDGVDPRVALDLPSATPLDATGHVKLSVGDDVHVDADAVTEPLLIAGNVVPAVEARAELDHGVWRGSAEVREKGAPTTAAFSFDKAGGLRFEVESRVASLRAVTRLRAPVDGSVRVKVTGALREGALDARVTGRVGAVRAPGGVTLDDGTIDARVHGPLAALAVDASVTGRGMRAGGYAWEKVAVHASGPATALRVETKLDAGGGESIEASGALDPRAGALRGIRVHLKRKDGDLDGEVARVAAAPGGGVTIEGVALHGDGVGQLSGGLAVRDKEIVGRLRGKDVDLAKVALLAGIHQSIGGLANVDVDLSSSRPGHRRGHVDVELQDGELPGLGGVSALLTAAFDGDRVRVDGLVRLVAHASAREDADERCDGAIAQLRVTGGDGLLAGPLLDPDTWRRGSGKVYVAAEEWNLRCLARLAPIGFLLSNVRGKLTAGATVERAPGERLPSVSGLVARTRGLWLDGPQGLGASKPDWESHDVDVEVKGSIDSATGKTKALVALYDGSLIASVDTWATLDVGALLDHPDQRWASLQRSPLSVSIRVPRRAVGAFGTLPSFVRDRLPPLAGDVALTGLVDGTIAEPYAVLRAYAWGLAHVVAVEPEPVVPDKGGKGGKGGAKAPVRPPPPLPESSPWALPIEAAAVLTYDGKKATLEAHVKHEDKEVLAANADLALSFADVLAGRALRPAGGGTATLTAFPVGQVPFLSDRGIDGHLSGSVAVAGLGGAPTVKVDLSLPDLKIGRDLLFDTARLDLDFTRPKDPKAAPEGGSAATTFALSSKAGGKLEVSAISEILWKNGLVPTLDELRPADVTATASRFNIAALGPLVAGVLSSVGGVLDGKAHVGWARRTEADKPDLSVNMRLTDGVFHIPQLGQELTHTEVTLTGGKGGIVKLEGIRADGTKGRITGAGLARFDGLRFVQAESHFTIKPGEELPLTLEGVPFGDAHGDINVVAVRGARDLAITVGIPNLHIDLPNATARAVQALDPSPDIEIVSDPRRAEAPAVDPSTLTLTFNIGHIELKSNLLDLEVAGVKGAPIKIELADKTRISGDLVIPRGQVEFLRKQFVVEHGIVHMRPEDSANPYVNATARFDSPDGAIYIDYVGVLFPILPEKLKLRSPEIPEDRIMSTLLLGGVEQATVGGSSSAGGVPGQSLAAQLIAQQFSTQIASNISTSIGANDDGTLRPGLVYNSGGLVFELSTYSATGTTASASTVKGQRTLITVDWRFWRNWLLRGRVDAGADQTNAGGDVLWQYRY